tara:strand:- start:750 stop:1829 length:1080 start_codon:yes stop_codon:yes gene_type:complete
MIKFFRKIRYDLMEKNKTGKPAFAAGRYFKYAIGEIVLVVLGILIALSLNNWNEKENQDAKFDKLIDALENEIIENIDEANYEIEWYRMIKINASKILSNKISRKQFLEDRNLRDLIGMNRLDINSDDINSLVNRQEDIPDNYKALIPHLKNYLKFENRYNQNQAEYGKQVTEYENYLIKTQPWYALSYANVLDSIALTKQVDFYLNSTIYKNFLSNYMYGYSYSLREMIGLRSASLAILTEIKRVREDFDTDDIKKLFSEYNLTSYSEKTCNDLKESNINFDEHATYIPLYNSTNETLSVRWKDDEDVSVKEIQLNPGEITINPVSKRLQENALIEIIFNRKCTKKYQAKTNGYLLIK